MLLLVRPYLYPIPASALLLLLYHLSRAQHESFSLHHAYVLLTAGYVISTGKLAYDRDRPLAAGGNFVAGICALYYLFSLGLSQGLNWTLMSKVPRIPTCFILKLDPNDLIGFSTTYSRWQDLHTKTDESPVSSGMSHLSPRSSSNSLR